MSFFVTTGAQDFWKGKIFSKYTRFSLNSKWLPLFFVSLSLTSHKCYTEVTVVPRKNVITAYNTCIALHMLFLHPRTLPATHFPLCLPTSCHLLKINPHISKKRRSLLALCLHPSYGSAIFCSKDWVIY